MGLDQPRHDRVGPAKEFSRFGSATAAVPICASRFAIVATADYSLSRRSVSTISTTPYRVSGRVRPTAASRSATGTNEHHDLAARLPEHLSRVDDTVGARQSQTVRGHHATWFAERRGSSTTSGSRLTPADSDSGDACGTVRNFNTISPQAPEEDTRYPWRIVESSTSSVSSGVDQNDPVDPLLQPRAYPL
jgi:hypothetical protein